MESTEREWLVQIPETIIWKQFLSHEPNKRMNGYYITSFSLVDFIGYPPVIAESVCSICVIHREQD